jgi:hypothetical protein
VQSEQERPGVARAAHSSAEDRDPDRSARPAHGASRRERQEQREQRGPPGDGSAAGGLPLRDVDAQVTTPFPELSVDRASVVPMSGNRVRERVAAIVAALPEATCTGDRHLTFAVRKKTFGYFLDDHHGDGRVGVAFKAAPGEQDALVTADPERFYVPAYLGAKGWAAVRLDVGEVDWVEVRELLVDAYRLQAPRGLVAQLDG